MYLGFKQQQKGDDNMSEFNILKCDQKNGVWDVIISGKSGITLRGAGLSKDATIQRLQDEIHKLESRLDWPDEDRIDIIGQNGPTGEHYDVVTV